MIKTIEQILQEINHQDNPYFTKLLNKEFKKDDFIETQIQFYFAVIFFSRPMAALAAKIPTAELRLEVIRNVWEEHGEGNIDSMHGNTFLILLDRLGSISTQDIDSRALWPCVRHFNTTLIGACVLDEYLIGVGMMGMIEHMFSQISGWIGKGIIENDWIQKDQLIHYAAHEDLDVKHSEDFFNVLKKSWEKKSDRYYIEQGLRLGAYMFNLLYDGLYQSRTTRLLVDGRSFHSRA
ncbi:MAG: hypothetical protein COA79_24210 [Planctomycetota bacterium]|nr:MAG: hypothetical protein COA79_24210 [Planctomycetota bacterium]